MKKTNTFSRRYNVYFYFCEYSSWIWILVVKDPDVLQIVGFTASIGIGKAKCKGDVIEHIRKIMANLDADELVSVKENIEELNDKINSPDQCVYLQVVNEWYLY